MLLGGAVVVFWVLLLLSSSTRRQSSKTTSSRFPAAAAMRNANSGDDLGAGHPDGQAPDVFLNPDAGEVHNSVSLPACLNRYEFSAGRGVTGFVEEPKDVSFVVREMVAVDSTETDAGVEKETLIPEHVGCCCDEEGDVDEDEVDQYFDVETFMEMKPIEEEDHDFEFEGIEVHEEGEEEEEEERPSSHSEGGRLESLEGRFNRQAGSEVDVLRRERDQNDSWVSPDCKEEASMLKDPAPVMDRDNHSDEDDYIEPELEEQSGDEDEEQGKPGLGASEESFRLTNVSDTDSDSPWEHEDIVEQLKLELRNVRTGGLTTIPEESESGYETAPNTGAGGGLKPMKMEENKDMIGEIQKVYKNYSERMRKLDILNYQTFHAIGLTHLKANGGTRCSAAMSSDQNSRKSRLRRRRVDPAMESVAGYYRELEMVYVGHVCLSWEILQWQYGKVRELRESGCSRGVEQYNHVAGELQLFRVLLDRFLEDEPFRGSSRVENYARTRCVLRSLLQVPAIRDDCFRDKKAKARDEDDAVSGARLMTLMEESMKVFRDFLRADKHEDDVVIGGNHEGLSDVVTSLRTQLQKKERRLKEMLRREGGIVKKFRRKKDDEEGGWQGQETLVCEVELRVIARALRARKLTRDQAEWCRVKMERIRLEGRRMRVEKEPPFVLFPC